MKSFRNYLIVLLALLLAVAAAFGWKEYQELIKLRAQVAGDESIDLRKRLADMQKRYWMLRDQLGARGRNTSDAGDPADPANALAGGGPPGGTFFGRFQAVMNNPEFQKLAAIQAKARLDASYAALFKALTNGSDGVSLTPQQLDEFKNLLVQKQQAMMDAVQAARDQGLTPRTDPQGFSQAIQTAQSTVDQQIQSTLGDAAYAAYQQYEQTLPQRNTVSQVQQALSYTQAPLTDDQASQLVQLLAQDQSQQAGSGATNAAGGGLRSLFGANFPAPVTAQAMTDAQGILSQPQLQALQQVQQTQQAQAQMMQLLRADRPASSAGAAAPAGPGG